VACSASAARRWQNLEQSRQPAPYARIVACDFAAHGEAGRAFSGIFERGERDGADEGPVGPCSEPFTRS
jgi:hypothetical protein